MAPGQTAAAAVISSSNRYQPTDQRGDFIKAVTEVEGVPFDHVAPWPGSSDPLSRGSGDVLLADQGTDYRRSDL